jgi:release factor glutamine methyltransferase
VTAGPAAADADRVAARLRAAGCVFAEDEAALLLEAADDAAALETLVARRAAGEPLEHLLGWVELDGVRWAVAPGVFVPRQRSLLLVAEAEALLAASAAGVRPAAPVLVDLCCGAGVLGAVVARRLARRGVRAALHAADVDPVAGALAARNVAPWAGAVTTGDLYAALPATLRGSVDVLLCHAPYVPTAAIATMPPEAREHEPRAALDGGADGLDVVRRVVAGAPAWLGPGGSLLFEAGPDQVAAVTAAVAAAGLAPRVVRDAEAGALVVVATASGAGGPGGGAAGPEAGGDAGPEAGGDAGPEAGGDAGPEAGGDGPA